VGRYPPEPFLFPGLQRRGLSPDPTKLDPLDSTKLDALHPTQHVEEIVQMKMLEEVGVRARSLLY
jgi:hypothetical protein